MDEFDFAAICIASLLQVCYLERSAPQVKRSSSGVIYLLAPDRMEERLQAVAGGEDTRTAEGRGDLNFGFGFLIREVTQSSLLSSEQS